MQELDVIHFGSVAENNWESLFRLTELFRKVAIEVGENLGYVYPEDLHTRMMEYVLKVKDRVMP
jgi:aminoglycoside 6-adenylyltransferase